MIEPDDISNMYLFKCGLMCSKMQCQCSELDDKVIIVGVDKAFFPPLHGGCDCWKEKLAHIKEAFDEED